MQHKKSLGQNFLKSKSAVKKMVSASGAGKGDAVLEIGPGTGILTDELLATGANVLSVEKDDRLIPVLQEKYKKEIASGRLILLHGDILNLEIPSEAEHKSFMFESYKLVANIPYYITGQVIRKFLEAENQPESMTLLVQKEVAERIVAKDKKESLLSLSVKAYGEPKYVGTVKRGAFSPVPNVDSAIIHIGRISRENFRKISEKKFFELIHLGFAHKRKQLLSNLSTLPEKEKIEKALEKINLSAKVRAEDVGIEKWFELCDIIFPICPAEKS